MNSQEKEEEERENPQTNQKEESSIESSMLCVQKSIPCNARVHPKRVLCICIVWYGMWSMAIRNEFRDQARIRIGSLNSPYASAASVIRHHTQSKQGRGQRGRGGRRQEVASIDSFGFQYFAVVRPLNQLAQPPAVLAQSFFARYHMT